VEDSRVPLLPDLLAAATNSACSLRQRRRTARRPVSERWQRTQPCRVSTVRAYASESAFSARLVCSLLLTCVGLMGRVVVALETRQWRRCPLGRARNLSRP
jgi:hypothetical protein